MTVHAIEIDDSLRLAAKNYRRARPLEQAQGWRSLVGWGPGKVVFAAALLAVLLHACILALWLHETPEPPPPPLLEPERLTVELLETRPPTPLTEVSVPVDSVTPDLPAPPPQLQPRRISRSSAPVAPEITAPATTDANAPSVSIDWNAALSGAAREQIDSAPSRPAGRLGATVPRLPGERSDQWSQPTTTVAQRVQQLGGMLSSAQIVGGDGLHSLVAAGLMEQEIDSRIRELQSECHPTADGRLKCPSRQR